MGYSKESIARLSALLEEIQRRKQHANAAATYRDVPALKEIAQSVDEQLKSDRDSDTLTDSIAVLGFLANAYDGMGRASVAAKFYGNALLLAAELKLKHGKDAAEMADIFYSALRARNVYADDDCADITALAKILLPEEKVCQMLDERMKCRRYLRHDPVEMTEEYLAVIDKVEEKVEKNRKTRGFGSCHEVWSLMQKYLEEYGIIWNSPQGMNPNVLFD